MPYIIVLYLSCLLRLWFFMGPTAWLTKLLSLTKLDHYTHVAEYYCKCRDWSLNQNPNKYSSSVNFHSAHLNKTSNLRHIIRTSTGKYTHLSSKRHNQGHCNCKSLLRFCVETCPQREAYNNKSLYYIIDWSTYWGVDWLLWCQALPRL